jgi:hypothetical protein
MTIQIICVRASPPAYLSLDILQNLANISKLEVKGNRHVWFDLLDWSLLIRENQNLPP